MITISLDEQGDFEGLKEKKNEPVFIGGILYDDRDDEADFENEKKRIEQYLRAVCEQVGAIYPQDLHVGDSRNGKKVRMVKIRLGETLNEFFSSTTLLVARSRRICFTSSIGLWKITRSTTSSAIWIYKLLAKSSRIRSLAASFINSLFPSLLFTIAKI